MYKSLQTQYSILIMEQSQVISLLLLLLLPPPSPPPPPALLSVHSSVHFLLLSLDESML